MAIVTRLAARRLVAAEQARGGVVSALWEDFRAAFFALRFGEARRVVDRVTQIDPKRRHPMPDELRAEVSRLTRIVEEYLAKEASAGTALAPAMRP